MDNIRQPKYMIYSQSENKFPEDLFFNSRIAESSYLLKNSIFSQVNKPAIITIAIISKSPRRNLFQIYLIQPA